MKLKKNDIIDSLNFFLFGLLILVVNIFVYIFGFFYKFFKKNNLFL